jgi:hypothetical protein
MPRKQRTWTRTLEILERLARLMRWRAAHKELL